MDRMQKEHKEQVELMKYAGLIREALGDAIPVNPNSMLTIADIAKLVQMTPAVVRKRIPEWKAHGLKVVNQHRKKSDRTDNTPFRVRLSDWNKFVDKLIVKELPI